MIDVTNFPTRPGCYIFKDSEETIIYIGKAKNLKKRVSSYFNRSVLDPKTRALVSLIKFVEHFITNNEVEALILENTLIKKHKPRFNIELKDSKRYASICVTNEKFPRIIVVRDKLKTGSYFGPFVDAKKRDDIVKILNAKFRLRTCSKLPKKACLRYHIGICSAPCIGKISESNYIADAESVKRYLGGGVLHLITDLKSKMKEFASTQHFEEAKILRDQVNALDSLTKPQDVEKDKKYDEDIINFKKEGNTVHILVFSLHNGVLSSKSDFIIEYSKDFLDEFVKRFYTENPIPRRIILPRKVKDPAITDFLSNLRKGTVTFVVPIQGSYKRLLQLVYDNIDQGKSAENESIRDIKSKLELNDYPKTIECFDISHIQGTNVVASMVQFYNGLPNKKNYRRFKLTLDTNDDFRSMEEVVFRRYAHLKNENSTMPDLIVVDGGKGQLTAAIKALNELELRVPIIALAKKFEEVYTPGNESPINLDKDSKALKLLMNLRDEAHRFAINYHKLLRSKTLQ